MKLPLCFTLLLAGAAGVLAQIPEGQTVFSFPAQNLITSNGGASDTLRYASVPEQVKVGTGWQTDPNSALSTPLAILYTGAGSLRLCLLQWEQGADDTIATHHFAIVGEVSCEKVSGQGFLEMVSQFESPAPGIPPPSYFSRTLAGSGPMAKLEGTSDWRPFWLPFDSTGVTTKFTSLEMFLHLTGPGTVSLRNLKLVQYPDGTLANPTAGAHGGEPIPASLPTDLARTASAPSPRLFLDRESLTAAFLKAQNDLASMTGARAGFLHAGYPSDHPLVQSIDAQIGQQQGLVALLRGELRDNQNNSFDDRSFLMGATASLLVLLAWAGIRSVWHRLCRLRHERELRRIASLDG